LRSEHRVILYMAGIKDFIGILGIEGAVIAAVEGTLIILIFRKARVYGKRKPEYQITVPSLLLFVIAAIFIVGAVVEITVKVLGV